MRQLEASETAAATLHPGSRELQIEVRQLRQETLKILSLVRQNVEDLP